MSALDMFNNQTTAIALIAIVAVIMLVAATTGTEVHAKKHKTGTSMIERWANDAMKCTTQDENNCGAT